MQVKVHQRCCVLQLTTGLSSPKSESRSASAMAYAGTGSRFFTRILAVWGGRDGTKGRLDWKLAGLVAEGNRFALALAVTETAWIAWRLLAASDCAEWYRRPGPLPARPRLRAASHAANQTARYQTDNPWAINAIATSRGPARHHRCFYSSNKMYLLTSLLLHGRFLWL